MSTHITIIAELTCVACFSKSYKMVKMWPGVLVVLSLFESYMIW